MYSRRRLLTNTAALGLGAAAPARAATPQVERARAVAEGMFAADAMPALSVAVIQAGRPAWTWAHGMADIELGVKATPDHRFRLGSGAKPVTATLAAVMAEQRIVDLDAPIGGYMPELPQAHRATTLRQLLTHRGGVRHYIDRDSDRTAPGGSVDRRTYMTNADILAVFIDDPLVARPGSKMVYSTYGYTLASLVLEAAAATPYLTLLQDKVARPMGVASLAPDAPRMIVPQRVSGYGPAAAVRELPPVTGPFANAPGNNPAYKWAGGGLMMTLADFVRFGAAHMAPGVLSRQTLDALFTVQVADSSPPLGLGWRINRDASGRLRWHHAGGQEGARSSLVVYPEQQLSIAFASNMTGAPGDVLTPSAKLADAFAS